MKTIPIKGGFSSKVDDEDFAFLSTFRWYLVKGYAVTASGKLKMHRLVLKAKAREICDHINRDKLDNRKANLRFCTSRQNRANSNIRSDNKSGYKGVSFWTATGKWRAQISGRLLGYYSSAQEAAMVYNSAAMKEFGEFSHLNNI